MAAREIAKDLPFFKKFIAEVKNQDLHCSRTGTSPPSTKSNATWKFLRQWNRKSYFGNELVRLQEQNNERATSRSKSHCPNPNFARDPNPDAPTTRPEANMQINQDPPKF